MIAYLDEARVQIARMHYSRESRYEYVHGPQIASDGERGTTARWCSWTGCLMLCLRINPDLPPEAVEEGIRKVARADSPSLITNDRAFLQMLTDGADVSWREDGWEPHGKLQLIDRNPGRVDYGLLQATRELQGRDPKAARR